MIGTSVMEELKKSAFKQRNNLIPLSASVVPSSLLNMMRG